MPADAATNENLNETLARVFKNIEASAIGTDSEDDLKGLFDDLDVNSAKLGATVAKRNEKLVKLLNAIGDLKLGALGNHTIDAFGDAYEFLITMYASTRENRVANSSPRRKCPSDRQDGDHKKTTVNKIYDPACGSGSLLLKFAKMLGKPQRATRVLWPGNQSHDLQPGSDEHVLAQHQLREVQHPTGWRADDPTLWDDETVRRDRLQSAVLGRMGGGADPPLINDARFDRRSALAPKAYADLAFAMHILDSWLAATDAQQSLAFRAFSHRAVPNRKFGSTWLTTTMWILSFTGRLICSTGPCAHASSF